MSSTTDSKRSIYITFIRLSSYAVIAAGYWMIYTRDSEIAFGVAVIHWGISWTRGIES